MKAKKRKEIEVTIIMSEFEAKWLKGIMRNPFYGQEPKNERDQDRKMRKMFWDILDAEGIEL